MFVTFAVELSFDHCSMQAGFRDCFDDVEASTANSRKHSVQSTSKRF
jgi:hypothetical protein